MAIKHPHHSSGNRLASTRARRRAEKHGPEAVEKLVERQKAKREAQENKFMHPKSRLAASARRKVMMADKKLQKAQQREKSTRKQLSKWEWFQAELRKKPEDWVAEGLAELTEWALKYVKRNDAQIKASTERRGSVARLTGREKALCQQRAIDMEAFNRGIEIPDLLKKKTVSALRLWSGAKEVLYPVRRRDCTGTAGTPGGFRTPPLPARPKIYISTSPPSPLGGWGGGITMHGIPFRPGQAPKQTKGGGVVCASITCTRIDKEHRAGHVVLPPSIRDRKGSGLGVGQSAGCIWSPTPVPWTQISLWEKVKLTKGSMDLSHLWHRNLWVSEPLGPPLFSSSTCLQPPPPFFGWPLRHNRHSTLGPAGKPCLFFGAAIFFFTSGNNACQATSRTGSKAPISTGYSKGEMVK